MARLFVIFLSLFLTGLVPASAKDSPSFYVTHSWRTDQPVAPGSASSEAEAAAAFTGNFLAEGLLNEFPCARTLTDQDAGAILGHEKTRQLLGSGGEPETLTALAGAIGADYLVSVNVTQLGGNFVVTITVLRSRTGQVLSKTQRVIKADEDAADELEAMAHGIARQLSGPKCPPAEWSGTVTVSDVAAGTGKRPTGEAYSGQRNLQVRCALDGKSTEARCSVSYSGSLKGKDGSMEEAGQDTLPVNITVGLDGDRLVLRIGVFTLTTSVSGTLVGVPGGSTTTTTENQMGGWEVEVPANPNGATQSGSATIESMTGTWNLQAPSSY